MTTMASTTKSTTNGIVDPPVLGNGKVLMIEPTLNNQHNNNNNKASDVPADRTSLNAGNDEPLMVRIEDRGDSSSSTPINGAAVAGGDGGGTTVWTSASGAPSNVEDFVGMRVAKKFRVRSNHSLPKKGREIHKVYFGTVVWKQQQQQQQQTDSDAPTTTRTLWHILYDDGDEEDLGLDQTRKVRQLYLHSGSRFDRKSNGFDAGSEDGDEYEAAHEEDDDDDEEYDADHDNNNDVKLTINKKSSAKTSTRKKTSAVKATTKAATKATPHKAKPTATKVAQPSIGGTAKEVWSGPPDDPLPRGWPPGWIKKIVTRTGGKTGGRNDRYWFSPENQYQFRSMNEVKRFFDLLGKTNGDEANAWKIFKGKRK
jgi:hypothetical protein